MEEPEAKIVEWVREPDSDIYLRTSNGTYYERPKIDGVYTFRSLKTRDKRDALAEWAKREGIRAKGEDPQPKHQARVTAGDCIKLYQEANYPDKQKGTRPEKTRLAEAANCEMLLGFWDKIAVEDILISECDNYHKWRLDQIKKRIKAQEAERDRKKVEKEAEKEAARAAEIAAAKLAGKEPRKQRAKKETKAVKAAPKEKLRGDRTVDLDLNTLRNALLWSARKGQIRSMPMAAGWPTYCSDKSVRHCREYMPENAKELHAIARIFFKDPRSEVLGFQILFEAYTGQRTIEALQFLADAPANEPGWVTPDGESLCVRRGKGQEMVSPFCLVHEGLKPLIEVWRKWKALRYPKSPWYFPGRDDEGAEPINKGSLAHALRRLRKALGKTIKPHGLRAFYVTVRRSHGIPDNRIAFEIGHTSGGKTLAEVYGGCPPHWLDGKGGNLKWLPDGDPAWSALKYEA